MDSWYRNTTQEPAGMVSTPESRAITPRRVDHYELVTRLGQGPLATMYLVRPDAPPHTYTDGRPDSTHSSTTVRIDQAGGRIGALELVRGNQAQGAPG
jgi:hypothetical protein